MEDFSDLKSKKSPLHTCWFRSMISRFVANSEKCCKYSFLGGPPWLLRFYIERGVRSDAQLSCTDTRFQKCSQSGKNGSKHPMLSISMAYNAISCKKNRKKHSKNQIRWFYYVNSAPELRNDQKTPKKRIT